MKQGEKMEVKIEQSWKEQLNSEFEKDYFNNLISFVQSEYTSKLIYPEEKDIFNAFDLCTFKDVKVVILGQDPYHGPNQAHGLSFSVKDGIKSPPSLRNIFKEINQDLETPIPESGDLTRWAKQGILLLNATLTVEATKAGSHQKKGWEKFTDAVIKLLSDKNENIAFILWGAYAQKKGAIIDESKHLVLKSVHPSPLSAYNGFFGNNHFSKVNEYLQSHHKAVIDW